jgi:DNA-binding response OmpR family regulator
MAAASPWLISVGAERDLVALVDTILHDRARVLTEVTVHELRHSLGTRSRPPFAIVIGGVTATATLDALRPLAADKIPTLVIVENLVDSVEASLLATGARDVVGLPASAERLRSRILAMARATDDATANRRSGGTLVVGTLEVHLERREVAVDGRPVRLTATEFDLLATLAREPDQVVSRDELGQAINGTSGDRSLESHMSRIRSKITAAEGPRLIHAVRGRGYRL